MILDCSEVKSREDLFRLFHELLSVEFGNNLDALHDILTSLPSPAELTLLNWSHAEASLGRYANALKRMLTDSQSENPLLTVHYK